MRTRHEKIQPVKEHHVADFGVERKRNATQVSSEPDHVTLRTTITNTTNCYSN